MKKIKSIKFFKTSKFSFVINNEWNNDCDLFRGIDIKIGFFYVQILRSI
jgi:hypothetical protein